MRVRSKAILAAVAALAIASGACGKVGNLQARKAFKEANGLYQAQNYKEAADKYQEVLAADPNFMTGDGVTPYFFIANSYDNLYKPARKGEAENDAFLTKAIENYKTASEKDTNPKMKNLALDYLVYAYGPDKLNDPTQAEPIVQKMIQLDPSETTNYFMLAKIYEDNGNLDQAEAMYKKAKEMKPKDAGGLPAAGRLLPAPGRVRQAHFGRAAARRARAEQPRSALLHRQLLLGRGLPQHAPARTPRRRSIPTAAWKRSRRLSRSSLTTSRPSLTRVCS